MSSKTQSIIDTLKYVKSHADKSLLIKIGGSVLDDAMQIQNICHDIALIRAAGFKVVIVHGGSKAINKALENYAIDSHFVDGLRVTTKDAMTVIEMVLAGHINKMLVKALSQAGLPAIGLSGVDEKLLQCDKFSQQHGCVGTVKRVNTGLIEQKIEAQVSQQGSIPVIAPVGISDDSQSLNVNADWAASHIAVALKVDKLIYLTDTPGIYGSDQQVLSTVDAADVAGLLSDNIIQGGMATKIKAILHSLSQGINNVHIISGKQPHALVSELYSVEGVGTLCKQSPINIGVCHDIAC